jgi:galactokinase
LEVRAFAPGRVNLIGEHTDYNDGLALPFAIAEGVTVRARANAASRRISTHALDLGEHDELALHAPAMDVRSADPSTSAAPTVSALPGVPPLGTITNTVGWRAFVRGTVAELTRAGIILPGADLEISGDLPRGAGLSSSAALEVALALALLELADARAAIDRRELARLCSRVEREWVGARTGLLDQLATLFGAADTALLIDFSDLRIEPVPLVLPHGWQMVVLDSGSRRELAASLYNERRAECARAAELLGVASLRQARLEDLARLPAPLAQRARHVLDENERVRAAASALRTGDLPAVGPLLDASHASLRDLYETSTPAVEAAVQRLREAGATGARMIGGGFGGSVLGLLPPGAQPPADAGQVKPSAGARLLARE